MGFVAADTLAAILSSGARPARRGAERLLNWVRTMNVICQHGSGSACLTLGSAWSEGDRARGTRLRPGRISAAPATWACPGVPQPDRAGGTPGGRTCSDRLATGAMARVASSWHRSTMRGRGFQGLRPRSLAVSTVVFERMVARLRAGGGMLSGGAGDAGLTLGRRSSFSRRHAGEALPPVASTSRHDVSRNEGRGHGSGAIPAGVRRECSRCYREYGLLQARIVDGSVAAPQWCRLSINTCPTLGVLRPNSRRVSRSAVGRAPFACPLRHA